MSGQTFQVVRGIVLLVVFTAAIGWFLWRWLKGSRDPAALVFRWILTVAAFAILAIEGAHFGSAGPSGQFMMVVFGLLAGSFLAVVWVPVITDVVSRKIGSLFDGGDAEIEAKPYYSIFNAKRSKGKYFEALAEVRRQLDKFPTDFEGQMFLAELQAENLNDLPGAGVTVHRFCQQTGHPPTNIAFALNKLADWHLALAKDRDSARKELEKIIELLPDSEMSLQAAQRIARLADTETLLAPHQRQRVVVKKGVENLGLLWAQDHLKPAETDPAQTASEYVKHLEKHPLDTHAREKLAAIYADHYHRLDLALDQLEQLVQQPKQPAKNVVRWLNQMADLQIHENAEFTKIRDTLQRIVDLYPDQAAAETARRRIETLRLELRPKEKRHQVQLGTYEQNIGLKQSSPHTPGGALNSKGQQHADGGAIPRPRLNL
jgi:tetratricopeptide (TPR) repeat protein